MRRTHALPLAMLGLTLACSSTEQPARPEAECIVPWDCGLYQTCTELGVCIPTTDCEPDGCPNGAFCASDGWCADIGETCAENPGGCECHILGSSGRLALDEPTRIILTPGVLHEVEATLALVDGPTISGQTMRVEVPEGSPFQLHAAVLVGDTRAGHGHVVVRFPSAPGVHCEAEVVSLGEQPLDDNLRITVIDTATGAPVVDATVVVDIDGDGQDDGAAAPTDAEGITRTTAAPTGLMDVTVFSAGYGYVTLAGLDAGASRDILVRLEPSALGGVTGTLDFAPYERNSLGGRPKTIQLAMVSTGLDLERLSFFDLDALLGGPLPSDVDCHVVDSAGNLPRSCHWVDIPGLVTNAPMLGWGGLLLSLATNPIKRHFDVVGRPGRNAIWAMGAEAEVTDLGGLVQGVALRTSNFCGCNSVEAWCEDTCDCDPDCGSSHFSNFLRSILPLIVRGGIAVHGNLPLSPASADEWVAHTAPPYGPNRIDDESFPRLDRDSARSRPPVRRPLRHLTVIEAPDLPINPAYPTPTAMEGFVALTGVLPMGGGFVPLGLGAGFDCEHGECRGHRVADDLPAYDGEVDASPICQPDPDPEFNGCPPDIQESWPRGVLSHGFVGLLHASGADGLDDRPWRTILFALPIDSMDLRDQRIKALVVSGQPGDAQIDLSQESFPEVGDVPTILPGRVLQLDAATSIDLQRVTFEPADPGAIPVGPAWQVWATADGRDVVLPDVPAGLADPLQSNSLRLGQASFRVTPAARWPLPFVAGGIAPVLLPAHLEAFAARRRLVAVP